MNALLMAGSVIVTLALVFYSVGVVSEQRKRKISGFVLKFITLGLICDVSGTLCMILGAQKVITWHGAIGYSALLAMLVDIVLLYRAKKAGVVTPSQSLHIYTRCAYAWWVIVYVSGCVMAMQH